MFELKENVKGTTSKYKTLFDIKIENNELVATYHSYESSLESFSDIYNSEIWRGNVVEIFIDVGRKNKYFEIEVAPNGTMFLAEITNINGAFSGEFIDECFVKSNVLTLEHEYITEIRVPLLSIGVTDLKQVKINAFRIENENNGQYLMSLNPTLCETFHKPECFLLLAELI